MSDLALAIAVMSTASTVFFQLGRWSGASNSKPSRVVVQLSALLSMLGYLAFLWDRPVLATLLPTSSLIILGNWLPCWAAFFVGIYVASPGNQRRRKMVLTTVTLCLAVYSIVAPVTGAAPACIPSAASRPLLCQTSPYTCSPACATSLLRLHGIDASERELADLCLTRQGTHWMGVYRGLKVKTAGTDWNVVVEPFSRAAIDAYSATPTLLSLNLDVQEFSQDIDHGFQAGSGHSVVCLGHVDRGYISVFDPSPEFGVEEWSDAILDCITSGVILRLVPNHPDSASAHEVERKMLAAKISHNVAGLQN